MAETKESLERIRKGKSGVNNEVTRTKLYPPSEFFLKRRLAPPPPPNKICLARF